MLKKARSASCILKKSDNFPSRMNLNVTAFVDVDVLNLSNLIDGWRGRQQWPKGKAIKLHTLNLRIPKCIK